jgi:hypothetical protein
MTDEPRVPGGVSAILAQVADQLDVALAHAGDALATGTPETTVEIGNKLVRVAQGGVAKGYWPNIEVWLTAFAATAVQRLAHIEQ